MQLIFVDDWNADGLLQAFALTPILLSSTYADWDCHRERERERGGKGLGEERAIRRRFSSIMIRKDSCQKEFSSHWTLPFECLRAHRLTGLSMWSFVYNWHRFHRSYYSSMIQVEVLIVKIEERNSLSIGLSEYIVWFIDRLSNGFEWFTDKNLHIRSSFSFSFSWVFTQSVRNYRNRTFSVSVQRGDNYVSTNMTFFRTNDVFDEASNRQQRMSIYSMDSNYASS